MWEKIKFFFEEIVGFFEIIFDLVYFLFVNPLLALMFLSPIFLIAGAVLFFLDYAIVSAVLLILGVIGIVLLCREMFF